MSGVNKAIIVGRLGNDPDIRTAGQSQVATMSVATSETWKDKQGEKQERTEWHRVVVWGKLAENAGKYLKKGKQVYIEGRIQTRDYEDKEGKKCWTTEIVGQQMQFLGDAGGGNRPPGPSESDAPPVQQGGGEVPL